MHGVIFEYNLLLKPLVPCVCGLCFIWINTSIFCRWWILNSWSKWGRGVKEDKSKIKDNKYNRPMMESVKRNITIYLALFETGSLFLFKCILLSNFLFFVFFFLSRMKRIVKLMSAYTHTASCIRNMHGKQSQLFSRPWRSAYRASTGP